MGRTSVELNCGLTVKQHGFSAEASGLMRITVVSTTQEVSRTFESSEGFMFNQSKFYFRNTRNH